MANGNKRAPLCERGDDLYETPPEATWALLRHERLPHYIWEPACGPGAIVHVLREAGHFVIASDLVGYEWRDDLGFAHGRVDFLMMREHISGQPLEAIVTNPPYKLAAQFTRHALDLCPRVYMLLRLAFITGGKRDEDRRAVLDGGQLARVLVFANRLPMMHRDGWAGPRASSQTDFAWFVWDRAHQGDTTIKRIAWEPLTAAKEAA